MQVVQLPEPAVEKDPGLQAMQGPVLDVVILPAGQDLQTVELGLSSVYVPKGQKLHSRSPSALVLRKEPAGHVSQVRLRA